VYAITFLFTAFTQFAFPLPWLQARADQVIRSTPDSFVRKIAECLHSGGEFLVDPKDPAEPCVSPRSETIRSELPFNIDRHEINRICNDNDPRALSGDIIKRIVAHSSLGHWGIRLIGGVYCDTVDLVGLELQHSLILDKAVFRRGIAARNLHVKGDFSIDDGLIFGDLNLNRARIDGSFYHGYGFIEREFISDTRIEGTWHQSGTVIFNDAQFRLLALSGDVDLSDSAIGHFSMDGSQIRGGLILNDSEVRCRFDVKTSDVGYILAERTGFGRAISKGLERGVRLTDVTEPTIYAWWLKFWKTANQAGLEDQRKAGELLQSLAVRELINNTDHKCQGEETIADEAKNQDDANIRFAILETHVKTNICLRSFTWLQWPSKEFPAANHPRSALILNGTTVDVGLIVTFQPEDTANLELQKRRKLEAKGLTAGSLIFQFSESSSYVTDLDGLKFGRIHNNLADCEFKSELPTGKFNLSGSWDRPVPPSVEQVTTWLTRNKNAASSTQPFAAFAEAFERIGEDATPLRVARATQELTDKTKDWWKTWSPTSFRATFLEPIPIGFQWGLWIVADHGYRPGKAVYGVLITLLIFWLIFWLRLNIIGFEPEQKADARSQLELNFAQGTFAAPKVLPIGILFLFDRLIPAFEIREENYSIGTVYGRVSPLVGFCASRRHFAVSNKQQTCEMRYLGRNHILVPLGAPEKERFKKWLFALRVIGFVWGGFLLAALRARRSWPGIGRSLLSR
jgi:hypothetical protein